MNTTAEQLPSVLRMERNRTERYRSAVTGLCVELSRVQEERDTLRGVLSSALQNLRLGHLETALKALADTLKENA